MWNQIAHERVKERLNMVCSRMELHFVFDRTRGQAYREYREVESRVKNSASKVPSRELEDAIFKLEDEFVQDSLTIYEEETPQRKITHAGLLWFIYSQGLVPFIEKEILRDVCFRLDRAQPSLNLDMFRHNAVAFFSYSSPTMRKEYPVVIRIVERLKDDWRAKTSKRAQEISERNAKSAESPTPIVAGADSQIRLLSASPYPEAAAPQAEDLANVLAQQNHCELPPAVAERPSVDVKTQTSIGEAGQKAGGCTPTPRTWGEVEIVFLSDDRLQIFIGQKARETMNYAEIGFHDLRTGNPNRAWIALRGIAEHNGTIRNSSQTSSMWSIFEKRVQEIRKILRNRFDISVDPIPFVEGTGYVAQFKISCGPSYRR